MRQFVFGYGSLAVTAGAPTRAYAETGFVVELEGFVRGWGVAMDNRCDLPEYKYYTASDGSRPAVSVAFLDIADGHGTVNGLCLPIEDAALPALDARERNYERVDVSDRVDARGARVWTYVGSEAGRERLRAARAAGAAVVAAGYLAAVRTAFAALGDRELARAQASLETGGLPVWQLERHELR